MRPVHSKQAVSIAVGATCLVLAAFSAAAVASSGIDMYCPETDGNRDLTTAEITAPALQIPSLMLDAAGHDLDTPATAIDEENGDTALVAPAAQSAEHALNAEAVQETEGSANDIPPTATRLPGVSETNQPRFRRQMFRLDI